MRALIMVAGAVLALTACRSNDQHDNTMNVDENLTAESIVSNDVTAIDAVTGDAANMAADINYTDTNDNSVAALPENTSMPRSRPTKSRRVSDNGAPAASNVSDNSTE